MKILQYIGVVGLFASCSCGMASFKGKEPALVPQPTAVTAMPLGGSDFELPYEKSSELSLIECKTNPTTGLSKGCRLLGGRNAIIIESNDAKVTMKYTLEINCNLPQDADKILMVLANESSGSNFEFCAPEGKRQTIELTGDGELTLKVLQHADILAFWTMKKPRLEIKVLSTQVLR